MKESRFQWPDPKGTRVGGRAVAVSVSFTADVDVMAVSVPQKYFVVASSVLLWVRSRADQQGGACGFG